MTLLNAAAGFTSARNDLKNIYLTFIRSVVEQSAVVWHSSLNQKKQTRLREGTEGGCEGDNGEEL